MAEQSENVTLRLPVNLKIRMRCHDSVNWSAVMRDLLKQKLDELDRGIWRDPKGERE